MMKSERENRVSARCKVNEQVILPNDALCLSDGKRRNAAPLVWSRTVTSVCHGWEGRLVTC